MGDSRAGITIFYADEGLDTGPILLQESTLVLSNDTVDSLYKRFLYPKGVEACARAVDLIAEGGAPKIPQSGEGATYEAMLNKPELQKVSFYEILSLKIVGAFFLNATPVLIIQGGSSNNS